MIDHSKHRFPSRRAAGAGLAATLAGLVLTARAQQPPKASYVIDTHAHVFHRGLKLADVRRYAPGYDAPLELYLRQLDENGMSHGVLVQPSFLGTDNSYILECLTAAKSRLRGIAVVDPATPFEALSRLKQAGVAGIRLNLVGQPLPDLSMAAWQRLLADIVRLDWQVEVQRAAIDLATLAPQLLASGANVVLDHFALPDPKMGVSDPGFAAILKLGASKRLWVKVSAPYRSGADGEAISKAAYPLLRDALGLDRLLWGSDWPHTGFENTQTYAKNRAFLDDLAPKADVAQILTNPRTLFGF